LVPYPHLTVDPVRTPTVARARVKPTSGGGGGDVGPVLAASANTGSSLLHIEHVAPPSWGARRTAGLRASVPRKACWAQCRAIAAGWNA